jgi:hypothetical protein
MLRTLRDVLATVNAQQRRIELEVRHEAERDPIARHLQDR